MLLQFPPAMKQNNTKLHQTQCLIKSNNSGAQSSNLKISRTSGDDPLWTLSDEEVTARGEESMVEETELAFEESKQDGCETIFSARDLKSVSDANRPSMD